jgi:membrane protein YqaA with SNARE-associated domain
MTISLAVKCFSADAARDDDAPGHGRQIAADSAPNLQGASNQKCVVADAGYRPNNKRPEPHGQTGQTATMASSSIASALGDLVPYAVGRFASERFLGRWGLWLGYMSGRQARAEALFERWGALTILITRTLISHLSSIVSLLAGLHRYRIDAFLILTLAGRIIWTLAYVGLGYALAGNVEAATDFLKNVTALLLSLSARPR